MDPDRKKRLIELGPEALADALLESAVRFDAVDDLIEHLIATPMEKMKRYKSKLAGLKRRRRFISWHESAAYAQELEMLLEDLRSGVKDPRTGVELVAAFYQADAAVFEQCDDSSGSVGNVFRFEAQKLFVAYASKCQDKDWLSQMVFDLTIKDDYGVRDILIDCDGEYLPESKMRELGPRKKIIPPLACLMARLLRYIHPHVSRYAQVDVPCRQTIIRRNRVELFLTVTLNRTVPGSCRQRIRQLPETAVALAGGITGPADKGCAAF